MPEPSTNVVEPVASPAPPKPEADPLTSSQWRSLLAFADAVIPDLAPKSTANAETSLPIPENEYSTALSTIQQYALRGSHEDLAKQYLAERPSNLPDFKETTWRQLALYVPEDPRKQLTTILSILEYVITRLGAFLLTGYATPFADQPIDIREQIIQSWFTARIATFRTLAKSLTMLCKRNWVTVSPTLQTILNFPRTPVHQSQGKSFPFEFIQFPTGDSVEMIETDVVIVGSGCGAGVAAKNIAEAGHKVIVVEQAYHWDAKHLPMTQQEASSHLFLNGASIIADDSNLSIAAGSVFGGGGTVNWSASLQTQGFVRREWAQTFGLPFFTSAEFQACLDSVCNRMGVSADHIEHNKANRTLMEGARKLGWAHKAVPQNTAGKTHYCGYCTLGCGSCEKQGPVVSFLPDAAKSGAKFIEGFECEEVLFEMRGGLKVAVGVKGTWTSRDEMGGVSGKRYKKAVVIKAKRVVVSGGTMQSPLLLKRSGLKNWNIGQNLRAHPVSFIAAVFPEEVRPWEGAILTSVVTEFENLDGKGHGVKLETTAMLPNTFIGFPVWKGGLDYKMLAPKLKHMIALISLARDVGSGTVYPDPKDGRARFKYVFDRADKEHIMEGLLANAKMCYVEGATEIMTVIPGVPVFKRNDPSTHPSSTTLAESDVDYDPGVNDPRFNAWLDQIKAKGLSDADVLFMSAHQMGTCRMGTSERNSVVGPKGKVWGTEGLYVCDASVFPSASGVNPMVTNMAIAEWISRGLAKELKRTEAEVGLGSKL
ncbi:long-chain fatty alcohol dehydrogenase [Rhizodiscina lignyota]|uniref:Long-chain-alcohol oxidase n=1 Tax=Rhizodiscina lignyota TaxID=1504668 RepID=A0A9P4ISI6_9PEZI|nr:long-chain fatty alcohol dehydrogenase [Rhizodiscina lignyota]